MMHSNITIKNNVISNMYNDGAIRVMNWKDCIISNNTITSINNLSNPSKQSTSRAILLSGTNNVKITKNYIANCGRAFQYIAWKNTGGGSSYPIIKDKLSSQNKSDLQNNWVVNLLSGEYFTRLTYVYNVYTNAEKISFSVGPYAE